MRPMSGQVFPDQHRAQSIPKSGGDKMEYCSHDMSQHLAVCVGSLCDNDSVLWGSTHSFHKQRAELSVLEPHVLPLMRLQHS